MMRTTIAQQLIINDDIFYLIGFAAWIYTVFFVSLFLANVVINKLNEGVHFWQICDNVNVFKEEENRKIVSKIIF